MGVLLASLILSACGGETGGSPTTTSEKQEEKASSDVEVSENDSPETTASKPELSIEKQIIFEQDGIVITVTGISEDEIFGPELNLLIDNASSKNITVQSRKAAINGYMVSSSMSCDVLSGKKANDSLTFMNSDIKNCGIDAIANIEFSFHIFESDSYDKLYDSGLIRLTTSLAEEFSQTYDDSGEVLYDENGIKLIFKELDTDDSIFGPQIMIYTENNTEQTITIQARNTSVNGFMVDPSISTEITPGNKAVSGMTFMKSQLEENNITDFETVETSFHIFNDNFGTIADTQPITISLK